MNNLNIGLDLLLSNLGEDDNQSVLSADLTYDYMVSADKGINLAAELTFANYNDESQNAFVLSGVYALTDTYDVGVRFGMLGEYGNTESSNDISAMISRSLNDVTSSRLQIKKNSEQDDPEITLQFIAKI